MPISEITGTFEKLREAMEGAGISQAQKDLLAKVEYHIHVVGDPDPSEPNFQQVMEMLVEDLEVDHPQSAALGKKILETLSNMGE